MPPNVLPAIDGVPAETEENRLRRELEEQQLVRIALPAVLGTRERLERLGGPAATPPFVPSDAGTFESSPRPGSPANPLAPIADQDPETAAALGLGNLHPARTTPLGPENGRPPERLLEPRRPMLPAVQQEEEEAKEQRSALERLAPWALGGLALGSSIASRNINPLIQGASGFFAGRQAAQQQRAEAARKAEEEAFKRAPKISVDTEFGSVSGIPLPSPGDAGGLGGVEGNVLELALRERGIPPESVRQRADYQLITDGQGNVWRVNRAEGTAEPVTGPTGAPEKPVPIPGVGLAILQRDEAGNVIGASVIPGTEAPEELANVVQLGTQYRNDPVVKDATTVASAYQNMIQAAESDSAAGDINLIFGLMKVVDPTSVVREGEFATAANSGGVPERLRNMYNRALRGTRLTDEQRADFVNQGRLRAQTAAGQLRQVNEQFRTQAGLSGFDPSAVDAVLRDPFEGLGLGTEAGGDPNDVGRYEDLAPPR